MFLIPRMVDSAKQSSQDADSVHSDDPEPAELKRPQLEYLLHGIWDTTCFGLFLKWIGFVVLWHVALIFGFREFMIGFCIITVGYCGLILSLAEMVSVIAFPGGYYGYARCAVHPFFGYLVGCSGIIENVLMITICSIAISGLITLIFETQSTLEPLWSVILHLVAILAHIQKRRVYWYMMVTMSTLCLCICLVYFLGSIPKDNFNKNVYIASTPIDSHNMLTVLFLPALLYSGTDLMVLTSSEVRDSKRVVPRAMVLTFGILVVLCVATIFCTISQPPGLRSFAIFTNAYGWSFGFADMLNVDVKYAAAYALLPLLSSMFGYIFVGGRGIRSMAASGLFPRVLASENTFTTVKAPLAAMCASSAFALVLQGLSRRYPTAGISILLIFYGAFIGYLGMLICYLVFKVRYSNLQRTFRSPLGIPGALISFGVFITGLISLNRLADDHIGVTMYGIWMGLFVVSYVLYGERHQTFAPAEQHEFFKVYLINMNRKRRTGLLRSKLLFWRTLTYGYSKPRRTVVPSGEGAGESGRGSVNSQKNEHTMRTASLEEVPDQGSDHGEQRIKHHAQVVPIYEAEENDEL